MDTPETAELDESLLTIESQRFARQLFARFPELRSHAAMERANDSDAWHLFVDVPAPSGDPHAALVVWMDGGDEPSVAFGDWHTHASVWSADRDATATDPTILDLIGGILEDRLVTCEDIGGPSDGTITLLDMRDGDALLDELTSPHSPGRVRVRSWSGRIDRRVDLDRWDQAESS